MLLVLVLSVKHWKNTVFSCLPSIRCDMIVVSILLNPHHGTAGWFGGCICLHFCHISLVKSNVFGRSQTFGTPAVLTAVFQAEAYNQQNLSSFRVGEWLCHFAHFESEGRGWVLRIDVVIWHFFFGTLILKAYWSGYGMNEDFSLKLPIEGFQNLYFPASDMGKKQGFKNIHHRVLRASAKLIELKASWNMFTPDVVAVLFLCLRSPCWWNIVKHDASRVSMQPKCFHGRRSSWNMRVLLSPFSWPDMCKTVGKPECDGSNLSSSTYSVSICWKSSLWFPKPISEILFSYRDLDMWHKLLTNTSFQDQSQIAPIFVCS